MTYDNTNLPYWFGHGPCDNPNCPHSVRRCGHGYVYPTFPYPTFPVIVWNGDPNQINQPFKFEEQKSGFVPTNGDTHPEIK